MSGAPDNTFEIEFGVLDGVVDEGNVFDTVSFSSFMGVLVEKSIPRDIGAVVSVGWKYEINCTLK